MSNEIELEIAITEIEEFLPTRIDGVATPANGAPFLMLKSVNGVPVEPPPRAFALRSPSECDERSSPCKGVPEAR